MQKFYMITGKDKLFVYEKQGNDYIRQYIEGNAYYSYNLNNAKNDIEKLIESLVNEYNMETSAEIEFYVIDNENSVCSEVVEKALGDYIEEKYSINSVLINVIQNLRKEKKLMIDKFGVNFDGKNYINNGQLIKKEFSLLGYTLNSDTIMKFIR